MAKTEICLMSYCAIFRLKQKKTIYKIKKKIEFVVNSIDFDFQIVSVNKNSKFHKINMREIEI